MANNKKSLRAEAVHWLSEAKQQGLKDLRKAMQDYQAGRIAEYELKDAAKRHQVIEAILEIFIACDIEPDALLEMLHGMKRQGRGQASLFNHPKNPM